MFAWFHLIFLLLTVGCQAIRYESAFLKEVAQKDRVGFTMSAAQLRQHLDELTYIYSSTIEQAADQVIAATPDRRVRQHALLWKINAIPAAQRAIFGPDPAVALIDAMAFSMQMAAYFESGRGRNDLGPSYIIALNAARRMESEAVGLAQRLKADGDISRLRNELRSWVAQNPVAPDFVHRPTVIPEMSSMFPEKPLGTLNMVGNLALSVDDITHQLSANLNLLPKQARWQAELLLTAMPGEAGISSGLASLTGLTSELEQVVHVVTQAPDLVAREREALLAALAQERTIALETVRLERLALLADIDQQREETLDHLVRERVAVMENLQALVTAERRAVLEAVEQMRKDLLEEAEAAGDRMVAKAMAQSKLVIDHGMLRLAQLGAAATILLALIAFFLRHRFPRNTR